MKFDLHVHTSLSHDSEMSTYELVEAARAAGLSGVATSDHNAFRSHSKYDNFHIIPSCEFSTDIGHLVVFFMKENIDQSLSRDEHGRFNWRDICTAAHEQGALVFYAHPFAPAHPHTESVYEQLDGIEVFNSRVVHSRRSEGNRLALELCRKLHKPFSAGSDAHCPAEVGSAYWECDLPEEAIHAPDFAERLKAELISGRGRVFAGAASPFTVLKCKRRIFKKEKCCRKLFKNTLLYIYTAIKLLFSKNYKGKYIDVYPED